MRFKKAVTYDDMLLIPQYSNIESRNEVDLSNDLSAHVTLDLPILSAPMDTVCEGEMAIAMARNGGMGILHRYNSIDEQVRLVTEVTGRGEQVFAAAIGITGDYKERAEVLVNNGVNTTQKKYNTQNVHMYLNILNSFRDKCCNIIWYICRLF